MKVNKRYYTLLILLSPIISILLFLLAKSIYKEVTINPGCLARLSARDASLEGLIKRKYVDSTNHNLTAIEFILNGKADKYVFTRTEDSLIGNKLDIKDYIKKKRGDTNFYVRKNGKIWKKIQIPLVGCEE
jgi:hypothetical protein